MKFLYRTGDYAFIICARVNKLVTLFAFVPAAKTD
jgi:hypothetical protein